MEIEILLPYVCPINMLGVVVPVGVGRGEFGWCEVRRGCREAHTRAGSDLKRVLLGVGEKADQRD